MKFARKSDLIIVAVIAVAGILFLVLYNNVFGRSGTVAEIYYQTELVETIELTQGKDEDFSLEAVPNVVFHLYKDGSIAFIESDCPDQICVHAGRLHLAGQFAACLPNQLYIKIVAVGSSESDAPDMIIG